MVGADIKPFKEYDISYTVHATYTNPNIVDENLLNKAILWADELNSKEIIFHPYMLFRDKMPVIYDKRILIENMPRIGTDGKVLFGHTPNQMKKLLSYNFRFCFDISHAIKSAVNMKIPYREFIIGFMELNPRMYHISDGRLTNFNDEHLPFGIGEFSIPFMKYILFRNYNPSRITLETTHPPETKLKNTVEDIRKFLEA